MRKGASAGNSLSGALEGFIAEVIEDHIREHMIEPDLPVSDPKVQAAEELVAIVDLICGDRA
jgi:DNA-binding FrmR family transcriptional regulator